MSDILLEPLYFFIHSVAATLKSYYSPRYPTFNLKLVFWRNLLKKCLQSGKNECISVTDVGESG